MKDPLKTWVSPSNRLKIQHQKKFKISLLASENKTKEPQDPKGDNWTWT